MAAPPPKVRRVGVDRRLIAGLAIAVVALAGALTYLLVGGPLFQDGPATSLERDYQLLVKGLADNPKDPAVLMSLAEVEYELGRKADAFDHAELALEYSEGGRFYNIRYATLLVREDRLDEAVEAVEKEIEVSAVNDAEPYFLLAQIQAEQEKYDDAAKTMATGLEIDPNAADMRIVLGEIFEKDGKKEMAITQFRSALRFLPEEQRAIDGLQRLGVSHEITATADPHGAGDGE